ncbi:hypothetical protein V1517DRAFT_305259 [Lipomyces orientalis]|uniref:Uncharacterized protein n=1 Tax=Lipomyces orientalis TaxID=1233043 RepID=A0ACC3TVU7_9ASCO
MSTRPVEFLRSAPYVVDPKTRIDQLKENLADEEWQHQKKNILKLIEICETGELRGLSGGIRTWLKDGEVLDHEPDTSSSIYASQSVTASQLAQSTSNGFLAGTPMHEIFANFRLVPEWGADPNLSIPVVATTPTANMVVPLKYVGTSVGHMTMAAVQPARVAVDRAQPKADAKGSSAELTAA